MHLDTFSAIADLAAAGGSSMEWAWFGIAVTFAFALLPFLMYGLRRLIEGPAARELAILEKELARKDLEPARRDQIVDNIAARVARRRPSTSLASRLMVGVGWAGLAGGIAVATITEDWEIYDTAVLLAVGGGILMTLPFVLREWDRRGGTTQGTSPLR